MTTRILVYARYSSDLQSASSLEDQLRLCEEKAHTQGWEIAGQFMDAAISGASLMRPGIQSLLQAALQGKADIVVCEALDRLSRNLSDIAALYQQLEFAGVKIVTLTEGEISTMHIGLKGTMNALFLKDLADKTRRGLRGKVEKGLSGGGLSYGYRVSNMVKGEREINDDQAGIIQRIFHEYAYENTSPKAIAAQLNAQHIPSPSGGQWSQSTINGNRHRGTGILNNDLYRGELVWNRQKFLKDPSSGKRVSRFNPKEEWIRKDVPELRIVTKELWDAAKTRQNKLDRQGLHKGKRPQYLLSGLLECGSCGGGYSKINSERFGCSNIRNKGQSVCSNKRTIKRETLENAVLHALETHLMRDDMVELFCSEYTKHMNSLIAAQGNILKQYKAEQSKLTREKGNIIQAIKDGVPASLVKADLERLTTREEELAGLIESHDETPRPFLHPTMAKRYRAEIAALRTSLIEANGGGAAREHVRGLIDKVTLTPTNKDKGLSIDLYGKLAEILSIAAENADMKAENAKRLKTVIANDNDYFEPSVTTKNLVAGAGFEPTTFGL